MNFGSANYVFHQNVPVKFFFKLQLAMAPTKRIPNTRAEAIVARSNTKKKEAQLNAAVKWCKENNARGHAALKTVLFNLIGSRSTIENRLDGKIITGCEKQYCSILTNEEEESVVRLVKNKNRCLQGINKKELTNLILDIVKIRDYANKGGRRYNSLKCQEGFSKRKVESIILEEVGRQAR